MAKRGRPAGFDRARALERAMEVFWARGYYLLAIRRRAPEVIKDRLGRAVAEGDLAPEVDIGAIAAFYPTVIHGLGIRAGDGASRSALMAAVDGAMAAWNTLTSTTGSDGREVERGRPAPASARKRRVADRR